jgi:hypothetical protein
MHEDKVSCAFAVVSPGYGLQSIHGGLRRVYLLRTACVAVEILQK